jgi:DNA replication protein DnaC
MMAREVSQDLVATLRRLKLSPVLLTLPERLRQARDRKMDPEDVLLLVLSDEVSRRQQAATAEKARRAGLDPQMVLDAWDKSAQVTYDQALLDELSMLRFVERHYHVLILGPVGVGKTMLAHGFGHIACARGLSVHCEPADRMLHRLKASRLDQTHAQEMRRLCAVDLLIVDDFAQRPMDTLETNDIADIVLNRHRRASMVVTSNREPSEWLSMMGEPLLAQALVDRLANNAYDLIVEGESYRARQKPRFSPSAPLP